MEPLVGYTLDRFPLPNLEHFTDLIYFEGPLLVHYVEPSNGNNYFYQWADTDDVLNRWLVYRVEKQKVIDYVRGLESLTAVMLSTSSEFIISVDIDSSNSHQSVKMVQLEALPQDYLPSSDSYYDLAIPKVYNTWIDEQRAIIPNHLATFYDTLRSDAIYLNVAPSDIKHGTTVAVTDIVDFLKNFNDSFINFGVADFEHEFGGVIVDAKRKTKIVRQLKQVNTLRAADVGPGSFGVALVPDFISAMGEVDPIIHQWLRTLISRFQRIVVNVDYNDPIQVQQLEDAYTTEQRNSFLKPYVKILENNKYSVAQADKHFKPIYKAASIASVNVEKLLTEPETSPVLVRESAKPIEEREVITLVVEKNKGQDISKMSGKQIASGTLFSQQMNQFPVLLNEVEFRGKKIKLREPATLIATKVNDRYSLDDVNFGISADGETAEAALALLKERIFRQYQRLSDMSSDRMSEQQQLELVKYRGLLQID